MIIVEVYDIYRELHTELKADEGIRAGELCRCIAKASGDADGQGFVISVSPQGVIPADGTLADHGIQTGSKLLYISETGLQEPV